MSRATRAVRLSLLSATLALLFHPALAQTPCVVPDNGGGTIDLPPANCGYVSPADLHRIIDGLPPGTEIRVSARHIDFFNVTRSPGGSLGGEVEQFQSGLQLNMQGTGSLSGFTRNKFISTQTETHVGPRMPGASVQSFDTDMSRLQGQLPAGDPDFDLLRITAGTSFGMPSPGHTTLTLQPGGNWAVDSFFDITYRIDFVGRTGGPLSGMSGSTTGTIRMRAGVPAPPPCTVADNGSGTITLPPAGCGYVSPADLHRMIDGLPPGTTIEVAAAHDRFSVPTVTPGGSLGGEIEQFGSRLQLSLRGTGSLAGYQRLINNLFPTVETHVAPRTPGTSPQSFDTDMFRMQGQITGDPDFDLLRITAGTGFGMPSPGHTTLTLLPSGQWNVDSFFDITYRIDFVGRPGGPLSGMSGSTTGTIRMATGGPPAPCPPIPAGTDGFPSTGKIIILPDGATTFPHVVRLDSQSLASSTVMRGPQSGDTIPTELTQLSLQGMTPLGPASVNLSPNQPALGMITGVVQDAATCQLTDGRAFFDVFFDLALTDVGETWFNPQPIRLEARIRELPPRNTRYENPFTRPVDLFDRATGRHRAVVLYELHTPNPDFPPGEIDCFDTFLANQILIYGNGYQTVLRSQGPADIRRSDPVPSATGEDVIQTEIIEMTLTGNDQTPDPRRLGPFTIRVKPNPPGPPSGGLVRGQGPGQDFPAQSFFDVFVELQTAQGIFQNQQPVHVDHAGPLHDIPPPLGSSFQSAPGAPIRIFDQSGGAVVGEISNILHQLGPLRSWQPPPTGGDDCFDSWLTLNVTIFPTGCSEMLMVQGPTRVLRGNPADPGNGMDEIKTLMAKLALSGDSQCIGNVLVVNDPGIPSRGEARSLAPLENFPMDSFFDVFSEIRSRTLGRLCVGAPSTMQTSINNIPPDPGEIYYGPGTIIPITDCAGTIIGQIEEVKHEVHRAIVCPCDCLPLLTVDAGSCVHVDSGAGAHYDIVKGRIPGPSVLGWSMAFSTMTCVQNNAPGPFCDAEIPGLHKALFYLARDGYDTGQAATYQDCVPTPLDADALITACPN